MSAKHYLHTAAVIPPHIPPSTVIAALHDHNATLTLQALTQGHEKLTETNPETLKDTWWYPTDLNPVTTYMVTEVIKFLPVGDWGKKYIKFPACYQDTPTGVRTRADAAAGVIVRAEFRVVRGGAAAEVEGEGGGIGDAEWVLVEDVEVTCAWWLMPFVRGKMEQAHRDICSKVMEKVEMEHRQRAVAGVEFGGRYNVESPRSGRGRISPDTALPRLPPKDPPQRTRVAHEVDVQETQGLGEFRPEKITYQ